MSDNKKPALRVSLHPVSAAIWRNTNQKGDAFYSVTFERSYRDAEGNWKSSDNFNGNELLLLAKIADMAHTEIAKMRASDKPAQPDE